MSELKVYTFDDMLDGDADIDVEYYLKSEADAVIAELEKNLSEIQSQKMQLEDDVALLRRNNTELKKERGWLAKDRAQAYDDLEKRAQLNIKQEESIRHHKYKRCLAMAKLCNEKWLVHNFAEIPTKLRFYDKWEKRWLELAEVYRDRR